LYLKYGFIASASYGRSNPSGAVEDVLGVNRSRQLVFALASYSTTCGQALRFFTRPKIEIKITPRLPVDLLIVPEAVLKVLQGSGVAQQTVQEMIMQAMIVTARRGSIPRLAMQVRLDSQEPPLHMNWGMGQRVEEASSIGSQLGPRYIPLEKDDSYLVWIWVAARTREGEQRLLYNVEGSRPVNLKDAKEPFIDFDIYFIPVENKPHKLRLNIKSWEELGLTVRD